MSTQAATSTATGPQSAVGEAPANWLSKIIEHERAAITRILPIMERVAERDAIVREILAHPSGMDLASRSDLPHVIWAALGVANHVEREQQRRPIMAPSPAIQASWFVFDEFGLPRPAQEF